MSLSTGPLTGCRRAGLVNGEAVNTGSLEACNVNLLGLKLGAYVVLNGNLTLNNGRDKSADRTLSVTRTSLTTGRSGGEVTKLSPNVTETAVGSINNYLKALVGAVLALNYCNAVSIAGRSGNYSVNVANTILTGSCNMLDLVIAIIVCTPFFPCRDTVLALKRSVLVVVHNVLTLVNDFNCVAVLSNSSKICSLVSRLYGNNVAASGTGAGLGCLSVGVAGGIGCKSPIAVCVVLFALKLSPVGEDRRFTSFTLVNGVAPLAALSGNDLDEYVGSIRHSMLCANTGTGDAISVRLAACCIRSCENGNNTADAHHDGKEKSTNSFRIVLH